MHITARLTAAMAAALVSTALWAEDYPSKTIRMVVPYPAGGMADKIAREASDELSRRLKQPVVVENRSGAAGNIGFDYVARQPADGYTLLLAPASNLTVQPALFKNLSYNLEKDFVPVSMLVLTPQVLVVHPSLPVNTPKELVEYARKNPGKVNYGMTLGAYSHLAGEMLAAQTGTDLKPVPYQGTAPALNDLLGGQTQFMFNEVITAMPHLSGHKLKPLAVAYRTRAPWLPNVPTMIEAGFPDFEVTSWYAVVAKTGTPQAIIDRVSKELHDIVQNPDFKKRYDEIGAFVVGGTPAELGKFIQSETKKWTAIVKQAGIQPN
ncbi:MAG TPA: tripartite tricarboxylate transporter substrate binding protein [Pseudorhodoferax sp.]|nr:tripartite tricarboxylate transporter substrate binding protein [Pseudorhodoferax sp.]